MPTCHAYIEEGVEVPPDLTWRLVDGKGFGGGRELLERVNIYRAEQGWVQWEWDEALYRTAYHSSNNAANEGSYPVKVYGSPFTNMTEQLEFYGYKGRIAPKFGGVKFWPKSTPEVMGTNDKAKRVFAGIWKQHPGHFQVGIANVKGNWTYVTLDENQCTADGGVGNTDGTGSVAQPGGSNANQAPVDGGVGSGSVNQPGGVLGGEPLPSSVEETEGMGVRMPGVCLAYTPYKVGCDIYYPVQCDGSGYYLYTSKL